MGRNEISTGESQMKGAEDVEKMDKVPREVESDKGGEVGSGQGRSKSDCPRAWSGYSFKAIILLLQ